MMKNLAKLALSATLLSPLVSATSQAQTPFTAVNVYWGMTFTGNLASLTTSDGNSLSMLPLNTGKTGVDLSVNIGVTTVSQLHFEIDQCIDFDAMAKVYYAYDWVDMDWRPFYGAVCNTAFLYEQQRIDTVVPISRCVSPNNDVWIRVDWISINDDDTKADGWLSHIDYAALIVTP